MNTFYRFDSTISVINLYLQHSMSCHEFCDLLRVSVMLYNIRKMRSTTLSVYWLWISPKLSNLFISSQFYSTIYFQGFARCVFYSEFISKKKLIVLLSQLNSWIFGTPMVKSAMPQTLNIATFFRQQEQSNDNLR